ncbi:hypothetical protein HID58_041493 [Brassica napus]|uniref:Uncharacterized protein n=1 Tax=Brassica napus TaxID=3708 RepID=A0ABQ8BCL1_BRANA|nr:hypothetical protein HID58_041493 [Brassica napus]
MFWFKSRAHKIPFHSFELEENMCALHGAEMKMFRLLPPQLLKSMAQNLCLLSVNLMKTLVFSLAFCRTINVSCYELNPLIYSCLVRDFGLSKCKTATFLSTKSGKGTWICGCPEVLSNEPSNENPSTAHKGLQFRLSFAVLEDV